MSNTRYLEFDSTYRNRNEWPLPGEFEIPISQTGRKNQFAAVDPVALSTPIMAWTPQLFDVTSPGSPQVQVSILPISNTTSMTNASDPTTVVISTPANTLQQYDNYYTGAVISFTNTAGVVVSRRIFTYSFLSTDAVNGDLASITVTPNMPDNIDYTAFPNAAITDPTDITGLPTPRMFIPGDPTHSSNGYISYVVYNETLREYRPIQGYDSSTGLVSLNVSTLGPITSWSLTDNYSVRLEPPTYPSLGSVGIATVVANGVVNGIAYTTSENTVVVDFSAAPVVPTPGSNYFKNWGLRFLSTTTYVYVSKQAIPAPVNQSIVVLSSQYDSGTLLAVFHITPTLSSVPAVGTPVELLAFSYDNCNPFEYDGSLVSQQQNVCYEVRLLNVTLPNAPLSVSAGGRIAFYPYVYVTLANSNGANGPNLLYSNNPNSTKITFRAPIYDVTAPLVTTFVNIDGRGMDQVMKFKPNDNMYFSVTLPNGEVYQTITTDTTNPFKPNPFIQISAAFSIRRITVSPISPEIKPYCR